MWKKSFGLRSRSTAGVDFGAAGEGWLRLSLSAPDAAIEEALARLGRALR